MQTRLRNVGKVPGSIIYTGSQKTTKSTVWTMNYDEKEYKEKKFTRFSDYQKKDKSSLKGVTWIDFIGLDQTDDLEKIGHDFAIHPLILEDIANIQQRPKIEDMDKYIFISLKMFAYYGNTHTLGEEQISMILCKGHLISFQEREKEDDFEEIKERIRKGRGKIRKMGADYLMYSLIDAIVDNYFVVLDNVQDDIELLQDELVINPTKETLPKIQKIKHNLMYLRKSIWPLREMIGSLQRFESDLIDEELRTYLRDVYDHTIQIVDSIETFRDIISSSLDIYLSSLSNRMNEIMKVLTIIGTIFIPLTFITGVYGMNFRFMPELDKPWTYPVLLGIMFIIGLGMLYYFRRKKWI